MKNLDNQCWGSATRVNLTGHESLRKQARCECCGQLLKVRPAFQKDNGGYEATLPRHNKVKP